ncbi:ABC transporter permease [Thioalbus denitrificans]|uniref:Transport permease protein n=1 Tax=Thioalbus denitrificans TaxID=547122 RepID=A0A369BZ79_9GAMM|nr:ABC transporter permease [Thioalbus denitrificans]RCX24934.1 lipooligosaccharide transport system permease protein [Thioalbus denitrificans]
MAPWSPPRLRRGAFAVWRRNLLVWRKLIGPAIVMNFGEPALYLLGLGYGLGFFVGQVNELPYLAFLASGIVASSAMTTAAFEGMYSVYTRMVPQRTYEALLATPLEVDDILAGEMLWCATKSVFSSAAILVVAALLGVVAGWQALWVLPVVFLAGMCFAGPAMMMSAVSTSYDFFNYFFVLVITPMYLLCGVFYPVETLPRALQGFIQFLPLTHAVALARPLVTGLPLDGVPLHLAVLAAYAAVSYYLAVVLVRRRLLV